MKLAKNLEGLKPKLAEALVANPKWINSAYYKKFLKEAKLEGNIDDESSDVAVTLDVLSQIIMGLENYLTVDFAKQYTSDKASMKIPLGTYGAATIISGGAFADSTPKTVDYAEVDFDEEYGVDVDWTRAHLEDATWDVLSEQNEGAGVAIKTTLVELLTDALATIPTPLLAAGKDIKISQTSGVITWKEFLEVLSQVDIAKYGPADYALVSPNIYWQLLTLQEFVSSLYAGSDEVMRTGIAKTMLGVTVVRCYGVAATHMIALNSKKAIALCIRRNITVEPYEYPDENSYGFVASIRPKVTVLHEKAVQFGTLTGTHAPP